MDTVVDEFLLPLYEDFAHYLSLFIVCAIIFFILLSWYYVLYFFNSFKKQKKLDKGAILYKFAVLVPARNEDKVIKNCLNALKNQDYPKDKFDVFVIIESKDDPTYKIVKKYPSNFHCVIRKNLNHRNTKGFALDEAYHYIKDNNMEFDAFMVFDADNIMNPDYISLMNDIKNKGFKVGNGYRNFTNATVNWVSSCSAVLFSFINNYSSYGKSRFFKKCVLTGTGYYIDFDIIDNEKGWIFNGMTEDVELTTYCYAHNISMFYYKHAVYYDEQPSQMSIVHKQHIRWVWGYFKAKKRFKEKTYDYACLRGTRKFFANWENSWGMYPFIALVVVEFIALLIGFGLFISSIVTASLPQYSELFWSNLIPQNMFWWFCLSFVYMYLTFIFIASVTFIIDNKNLKFKRYKVFVSIFTFMFFMCDFVFAFLDGLFHKKKRTSWDKIIHKGEVINESAQENINGKKKKG